MNGTGPARRAGRAALLLGALTGAGVAPAPAQDAAPQRPNILWISVEDISPHLGSYGDPVARTPRLDQLAAEGTRYTNVFTVAPVCAPNRSGIITGMYPTSIGTHHMRTSHVAEGLPTPYSAVPPPYVKAFTEYLRAAGYYCTNNSKTDYQFDTPISAWDESGETAHWRDRKDPGQPFFAVFNFETTHESQNWPEPESTDPASVSVPPYYPDTPVVRRALARLYDNIARVDQQAGEVLDQLESDGLAEKTIVFFWSDHGDGLPRAKRWLYDSGTHIPLIVRWPDGLAPGTVSGQLISSIDLGPTVLSLAGVPIPYHMQGRAFLGPQAASPRARLFSARDRFDESYDMVRSVRDFRFRYVRNYYPDKPYVLWIPYRNRSPLMQELLRLDAEDALEGPQKLWFRDHRPPEELYDCQEDPFQVHNLVGDVEHQAILERLRRALDDWRAETGDLGDVPEKEMVRRFWPDAVQPETARPAFVVNAPEDRGSQARSEGGTFTAPMTLSLHCPTQGASIVYTLEAAESPHWLLYVGPLRLPRGETTVRARAIRYGYKESPELQGTFDIR
jgi:N-sulfoglucosamine sulfohydrolase